MPVTQGPVPLTPDDTTKRVWDILEVTTDCVWMVDANWEFIFLNARAVATIAQGRDLLGMNVWKTFPGALGTTYETNFRQAVREKITVSFDAHSPDLDILFEVHAHPSGSDLVVFFRDITVQRAKELELKRIEERYRLATLSAAEGIWDWDLVTDVAYFSNRWNEILGLPAVEFTGSMTHWHERFHPRDVPRMEDDFKELETSGSAEFQHEYRICHEDGSWHWILSRGSAVRNVKGTILRMTGSISDITEKKSIDPLTNLQNRLSLLESLEHRLAKPLVNQKTFAVLIISLSRFTQVKEAFGQPCGDTILIKIAKRLQITLEGNDLSVLARISGHSFCLLLERVGTVEDVIHYAHRLLPVLEQPVACDAHLISLSPSIGIAMGDEGYALPEEMLEDATLAMHQAERSRPLRCVVFGAQMREQTRRRVQIEIDIHSAANTRQFILHYQPMSELSTGRIMGFEALLRWQHPTLGLILPDEFIPYAEESGVILKIGHWTLCEAVHQLARWRTSGLVPSDLTMSVNLSARQLEDPGLIQEIQNALLTDKALPSCLSLEITESALIGNLEHAREILGRLRQLGVGLDLDDFGTGFSSLSYLHRLPFHAIKIDRSFIRELKSSQESRAIANSIIRLGESLNMRVIAEGIETIEQRNCLIELGCLYGQGYFYSKPLDSKMIEVNLLHPSI